MSQGLAEYRRFIESKKVQAVPAGFEVSRDSINSSLFQWQGDCVHWALRKGRSAFFWDCGLGKTLAQLEWAAKVHNHTGKPVLILAPILVGWQTQDEAKRFNIQAPVSVVADQQEVIARGGVCISNYEKLHKFDTSVFSGVVLDESQILRSFMGKTRLALTEAFRETPYKLCCSATPAPNDMLELLNQSDWLGIMPAREAIARWFINDTMHAGNYRLMRHAVQDFWQWVSSWAVCLGSPADLGFPDDGYRLPGLNVHEHIVEGTSWFVGESQSGASATNIHGDKRKTLQARCEAVASIVGGSTEQWAIWCGTDYEADELLRQIGGKEKDWKVSGVAEVRGSHSEFWKETILRAFRAGDVGKIIIKPKIAGFGVNWQHCHNTTWFASWSFADYYQAIRRMLRFGQLHPVNVHLVASQNELNLLDSVKRKSESHEFMKCEVAAVMRDFQQSELYGRKLAKYEPKIDGGLPSWLTTKV